MDSHPLMFAENDIECGGKEGESSNFNAVAKATIKIRLNFLRKVYGLLAFQLLISAVVASVCMFNPVVRHHIQNNDWMVWVGFIFSFILLIALHMKRREHPTNLVLLSAFTVVQAYTIGVNLTFFDKAEVLYAVILTLGIVSCLSLYTFQARRDFSCLGFSLFAGLGALIIGGILQIFIASTVLELLISIGGAFLFSLFIIFDTQMIMNKLSPEEYILATINLYLDIVNLFMYILRILVLRRR